MSNAHDAAMLDGGPKEDRQLTILEDHRCMEPDEAALLMRAVLAECSRNAHGDPAHRVHVRAVTFARLKLVLHVSLFGTAQEKKAKAHATVIAFGAVARDALKGRR